MEYLDVQSLIKAEALRTAPNPVKNASRHLRKKNKFEIEMDKDIENYLQPLTFEDGDPSQSQFFSPEMRRVKMREELTKEASLPELLSFVTSALKTLQQEKSTYLDKEHLDAMTHDFMQVDEALEKIPANDSPTEDFQHLLQFSDLTMDSISTLAIAKFTENHFPESLSLYILLATLVPENEEHWLRAGIMAYRCENYELAVRLFSSAITLEPLLLIPRVFSVDCYLKRNLPAEAEAAYVEAMKLSESVEMDEDVKQMLELLKTAIKNS